MCAAAVLSPTPKLPVSCVFWRRWLQGWQPLHAAIVGTVMAILLLLWWFSSQHWQTQARQVDQAARMQQAGMAAIVAENLRQVVEKAQLAAAVAQQGLWAFHLGKGHSHWRHGENPQGGGDHSGNPGGGI